MPQYVSTLQTRMQAHTAADVFILTAEDKQLVGGGFVKDLTGQKFLDDMNTANRDFMTVDGKVYGLSTSSWAGGIMYNKDLLAKAGADALPDSWDGLLKLFGKLKDKGITPYYDAAHDGNFMALWGLLGGYFDSHGGFPDADIFAGKTTFAETWTEPLVDYCKLYTGKLTPKTVLGLTSDQVVSEFANGRVAMFGAGTWNVPTVQKSAPHLTSQTEAVPGVQKGTNYWTGAASPGYAINPKAKNPEAAQKFLQFLASPDAVKAYGKSSGAITTTSTYTPSFAQSITNQALGARSGKIYLPVVADGYTEGNATWAGSGKIGSDSLSFDGTAVTMAVIPSSVIDTSQSYTVGAWVKLNSASGNNQTVASLVGGKVSPFYLQLSGGKFTFVTRASDANASTATSVTAGSAATTGTCYHVLGVYDTSAQTISLYVNGTLSSAQAPTTRDRWTSPTARSTTSTSTTGFSAPLRSRPSPPAEPAAGQDGCPPGAQRQVFRAGRPSPFGRPHERGVGDEHIDAPAPEPGARPSARQPQRPTPHSCLRPPGSPGGHGTP